MHKKLCKCRAPSIDSPKSSTRWKLGKHNCLHELRLYLRMTILRRLCWKLPQINWVKLSGQVCPNNMVDPSLDNLTMLKKIGKLGIGGSSKIFSLIHLFIMKSVHDGLK